MAAGSTALTWGDSCLVPVRPGQDTHLQYGHETAAAPRLCPTCAGRFSPRTTPTPGRPCTPPPQRNRLQASQVRNRCREVNGPGTPSSAAAAAARVRTQNPAGQSRAVPTEHTHRRGLSALGSAQWSCTVGSGGLSLWEPHHPHIPSRQHRGAQGWTITDESHPLLGCWRDHTAAPWLGRGMSTTWPGLGPQPCLMAVAEALIAEQGQSPPPRVGSRVNSRVVL